MKPLKWIIIFVSAGACFSQQNLQKTFTPLRSSGIIPTSYTQQTRNVLKQDLSGIKTANGRDRELKSTFLTSSHYEIERVIRSGAVIFNDEITRYLNLVADELLKNDPVLRKQLSIFTLKSPVVNAFSYHEGYIFIDIGLIAKVKSEAQLAYIMCHEISHIVKQHSINSYIKNTKEDKDKYKTAKNEDARLVEKCQYSREKESEADAYGLTLLRNSKYNTEEALSVFEILQYSDLPFEMKKFEKSFLETPGFKIPESYFLKTESPIRDNSNDDDSLHTHPNVAKRKAAITNALRDAGQPKQTKVNFIIGEEKFNYIRDLARMEMCRLYLKRRDYPNALYAAYLMSGKYANNEYLAEVVAKSLYGISLYRRDIIRYDPNSYLPEGIKNYSIIGGFPQQIYYMINAMPADEWSYLSLNYVYRAHKKFQNNEKLSELSDSLFSLSKKGTVSFERLNCAAGADTVTDKLYYKNMFCDLIASDTYFKSKISSPKVETSGFQTLSQYNSANNVTDNNRSIRPPVNKILVMEPLYFVLDLTMKQSYQYIKTDKKQEEFTGLIKSYASKLGVDMAIIDPNLMGVNDVEKINDYLVITDWMDEYQDSNGEGQIILNTNEIGAILAKYGTPYIMRPEFISVKWGFNKHYTILKSYVMNTKTNYRISDRLDVYAKKDRNDLVHTKTFQLLYDIKHPSKRE